MTWLVILLLGGYYAPEGPHPEISFVVDTRIQVENVSAGFRHSPLVLTPGDVNDIFSYYIGIESPGEFRVLGQVGYSIQRRWVCTGLSCEDPPGPGQRFIHDNGFHTSFGVVYIKNILRAEVLYHHYFNNPPINNNFSLTVGAQLIL